MPLLFYLTSLILIQCNPLRTEKTLYSGDFSHPLLFIPATAQLVSSMLAIAGFLLVVLATIDLGDRLGVVPAKRGARVQHGVYRYLRHPMYLGYFIAELGFVLFLPKNAMLFTFSMMLYYQRIRVENNILFSIKVRRGEFENIDTKSSVEQL